MKGKEKSIATKISHLYFFIAPSSKSFFPWWTDEKESTFNKSILITSQQLPIKPVTKFT